MDRDVEEKKRFVGRFKVTLLLFECFLNRLLSASFFC